MVRKNHIFWKFDLFFTFLLNFIVKKDVFLFYMQMITFLSLETISFSLAIFIIFIYAIAISFLNKQMRGNVISIFFMLFLCKIWDLSWIYFGCPLCPVWLWNDNFFVVMDKSFLRILVFSIFCCFFSYLPVNYLLKPQLFKIYRNFLISKIVKPKYI